MLLRGVNFSCSLIVLSMLSATFSIFNATKQLPPRNGLPPWAQGAPIWPQVTLISIAAVSLFFSIVIFYAYFRSGHKRAEKVAVYYTTFAIAFFVFSIVMSQIITEYFVSGFNVILPTLIRELNISQSSSVWPATAFSLVIASTLLVFGRLGDMYGGFAVYIAGLTWLLIWSIVCGFSTSPIMMDFCRALQGLGAAAFLPSGVMLLGSAYRPGPRKNIVFSLYGTFAVVGFFVGIFFAGLVGEYLRWGFYFWFGGILAAITLFTSVLSIRNDWHERRNNKVTHRHLSLASHRDSGRPSGWHG